ncbi:hypothetical protein [Ornithinibacillus sp. 179-J 7C1 HS]
MRKMLVALFLIIIIGFGIVGVNQQLIEPEEVIKPANPNTLQTQS